MTKEEKIKEAWAGFYTNKVDKNGWLYIKPQQYSNDEFFDRLNFNSEKHSIRPKSLSGIENNNGWIKVESEDDLPIDASKEYDICRIESDGTFISDKAINLSNLRLHWIKGRLLTHYKVTDEMKKPIY